ncbi:MAG TPA: hypothetical protein VK508_06095 [Cyclobacteriaceae bacterium]|nr:hypothetical protein [Cyclobacteriaceae bacterium]
MSNKGFDTEVILQYKQRMLADGRDYVLSEEDESTDEYAHFLFIGKYEGTEVIYDAALYTLRLQHESEMLEIAEHRAAEHFPEYKKISYDEDENANVKISGDLEEEIGLFMAEVIVSLEEEGEVQVQEHIDIDEELDFGIGLDVGLNVDEVTPAVITRFITLFNDDTLKLDPLHYSFQTEPDEAE